MSERQYKLRKQKRKGQAPPERSLSFVRQGLRDKQRHIAKHKKRKRLKRIPGFSKQKHYLLASLLSEAFIQRKEHIRLRIACSTKFPAGFPMGVVEAESEGFKVVRILVAKALAWMCDMRYNELSLEELNDARKEALLMWNRIERRML